MLRIAIIVAGFVPVSAGLAGAVTGFGFLRESLGPGADSHARYLSGLLLGLGLGVWWCAADLRRRRGVFAALCAVIVVGGCARLGGLLHGMPPLPHLLALGMELVVTPALWAWSSRSRQTVAEPAIHPHS